MQYCIKLNKKKMSYNIANSKTKLFHLKKKK